MQVTLLKPLQIHAGSLADSLGFEKGHKVDIQQIPHIRDTIGLQIVKGTRFYAGKVVQLP